MTDKLYSDPIDIPLIKLKLDPDNVRFRHIGDELTESQIETYLFEEEDVRLLMKGIISARQLYQPILVIKESDGRYAVKEGNRRTVALRKIAEQIKNGKITGFAEDHFDNVPVCILTGTEKEIDVLLGTIHVSGSKEWKTTNRGYLIYKCIEVHGDDPKQVADEFGMMRSKVMNAFDAFKATELYGKKYEKEKSKYVRKFSFFEELYKITATNEWVEESVKNLDYFIDTVGMNKMTNHKDVRKFAKLLQLTEPKRSQALDILNTDNINEAWKFYEDQEEPSAIWKQICALLESLRGFPYESLKAAIGNKERQRTLADLISLGTSLQDDLSNLESQRVIAK